MSGHSKWATTKRAKAITDSKRSAAFTKITNLITMAAREKGGDINTNFSLRVAVEKGRAANMPKDNIERAIKRGTGELAGNAIEELYYEGVGPAQVQFVIKCVTDSRNRAAASIRHAFSKHGGSLGSVLWNFDLKGIVRIDSKEIIDGKFDINQSELDLIDCGAEDIQNDAEGVTVITAVTDLQKVKNFFDIRNVAVASADIEYLAKECVDVSDAEMNKVEKFIDVLEDDEDVSDYFTNLK
ncbi:MAG: YebC/PmpR family DNA-binding transcriptional regulator [bacterium]